MKFTSFYRFRKHKLSRNKPRVQLFNYCVDVNKNGMIVIPFNSFMSVSYVSFTPKSELSRSITPKICAISADFGCFLHIYVLDLKMKEDQKIIFFSLVPTHEPKSSYSSLTCTDDQVHLQQASHPVQGTLINCIYWPGSGNRNI